LQPYLSQKAPPYRLDSFGDIIRSLPVSESFRLGPTFPSVPCRA
jgi:hypothetical protein